MADNFAFTPGNGATGAADDIGGVLYPRVKATWGPDGTANDTDVASGKAMPVQLRGSAGGDVVKLEDGASGDADPGVPILAVRKATPANTSGTDGDYEFLQMLLGHLWVAPPPITKASANFTSPNNTSHAANDALADNSTAGSVTKLSFSIGRSSGVIRRVKIRKSDQTVATPTIRAWFWDATFTVGAGDDAAFTAPLQDAIGFCDVAVTSAGSDDAVGFTSCDIPFASATVFCLLQTLSTFTVGASEVFTVEIHYIPG